MSAETRSPSASPSANSSDSDASPAKKNSAADGKPKKCRFNDCDNLAVDGTSKCAFHKNRRQCCVENCTNQVYARKLCVRHGGKKQCQADNCEAHARGGGFCLQHGGFVVKRFCIVEGCSKQAHARQKCVRHGGGRRCKVDGCMQHARAGGLCNRHSHGHECREVPELNISKGGRLSSKKRQQQQREQQMKQEQFHHQQIQQQIHAPQHMQPHPLSIQVPQSQPMPQQNQQQSNPFGLPLKINFPNAAQPRVFALDGASSPQIDNSQLPSVLAMTNSGANATSSGQRTPGLDSFLASGPPSVSRGNGNYLSLGAEDAMMSDYIKLMGPDTPMNFHHHGHFGGGATPLLENLGNVFEHNQNNQNNANNAPRNHMAAMAAAAAVHGNSQQRMKMDFLSPRGLAAHNFQSQGFPTQTSGEGMGSHAGPSGSSDYAPNAWPHEDVSVSAATTPTPKPTGVTAA
ncbi:hypothetical protein GQ600_23761 [Phytophthora cactorum]|nr:hypothetical protein GQ600_23761 [Phytophthora cactorum]